MYVTELYYACKREANTLRTLKFVGSLTIHINRRNFGLYGEPKGSHLEPFSSDTRRIIGLFGASKNFLDHIGVVIILDSLRRRVM